MTDIYIWQKIRKRFQDVITEFDDERNARPETMTVYNSVVIEPNETDNRPADELWFEIFPLPSMPHQQELGASGRNRWSFGLQININSPKDRGTYDIDEAYDFIASRFKRGDIFDGIRVTQTAYRSSARLYEDFYSVPVTVTVQADLNN